MEYERIDKPMGGIISPSKLRAKLMGLSPTKRKEGLNSHSSRTSPARAQDSDFAKNRLLASTSQDFDNPEYIADLCGPTASNSAESKDHCSLRESTDASNTKALQSGRSNSGNSSTVHPLKSNEDENLDYDSNASSSSFEFHKGEGVSRRTLTRSLSRPTSYKWNDAEKWIMNKKASQGNYSKSHSAQSEGNRMLGINIVRVAPEGPTGCDNRLHPRMVEMKGVEFWQPAAQGSLEKLNLAHSGADAATVDLFPPSKDLKEVCTKKILTTDVPATPAMRAISMKDMGTEMTPVTSQEPSRTSTPVGATTPFRSPTSSIPSTPRAGESVAMHTEHPSDSDARVLTEKGNKELSEQDMKLKTRREIVALGMQLGKMNIAAWASKYDNEKSQSHKEITDAEERQRVEFGKCAAAWEEAEKLKHAARYKREDIKIQAWESQQKAKLEEELRRIEAKVEQLRMQSEEKMVRRINMARKKSEEKRAAAEAKKKLQAEKTAAQAEYIRQTGRIPSHDYVCCGLFTL